MKEKKDKKKWGLILFIVFIMIGTSVSFVFFGFEPQNDVEKYEGIRFVKFSDRWEAKINGIKAAFSFLPTEVGNIFVKNDFASMLQGKLEIDVTYDLNNTYKGSIALAQHQMGLTVGQYNIFVRKGFTTNNTFNMPVITCHDATSNVPVVYFRNGNLSNIHSENGCFIVEAATNADFIKAKDRILYGILGVIK